MDENLSPLTVNKRHIKCFYSMRILIFLHVPFITFYDYLLIVRRDKHNFPIFTNVLKQAHHFVLSKLSLFINGT